MTPRQCPSCGDISTERAIINKEVDKCLNCGYEGYVWDFRSGQK